MTCLEYSKSKMQGETVVRKVILEGVDPFKVRQHLKLHGPHGVNLDNLVYNQGIRIWMTPQEDHKARKLFPEVCGEPLDEEDMKATQTLRFV